MRTDKERIRNFVIIAHIDHGKSTLADRMLELTHTIPPRKMREQVLDRMELERERGITIKMQPVRMIYRKVARVGDASEALLSLKEEANDPYILNLIDTPGHTDFSYEVSRSLRAVEGAVLLVDATKGVEAQTISTFLAARDAGLTIIPTLSKIDSPLARISEVIEEVSTLTGRHSQGILFCSGRTGEGVASLLDRLIEVVPAPRLLSERGGFRALVFDFSYSNHRGLILYVRIFDGTVSARERLILKQVGGKFEAVEVGILRPEEEPCKELRAGEIGYIVTGIKEPGLAYVGDTVTGQNSTLSALAGYETLRPVVWSSLAPESQDDFAVLREALGRLRLYDAALNYEVESTGPLGRGFRCGFLGMLHLEIVTERLKREFALKFTVTAPSVTFEVTDKRGYIHSVYSPSQFPSHGEIAGVREPWVDLTILTLPQYLSSVIKLLYEHEAELKETFTLGESRIRLDASMPLRELMRNFFTKLQEKTAGYSSLSYVSSDLREANVVKLEVLIADEEVSSLARIVSHKRLREEARRVTEKLAGIIPQQLFAAKIQARAEGRIIARETIRPLRKDVTGYLYGGDVTRKMKLLKKQRRGKKKLRELGRVEIPHSVYLEMLKPA